MQNNKKLIILIAPNVSEQMGGEAMKALQIFQEYKKIHEDTVQITHERNFYELSERLKLGSVYYIKDDFISLFLWKTVVFRFFLTIWTSKKGIALAEQIATERGFDGKSVVIHQTEPNSPVSPRKVSQKHLNVFGPINGNIYYPKIFHHMEKLAPKLRRLFHFPSQKFNKLFPHGLSKADLIFVAGGKRTWDSLVAGGCDETKFIETVDCGIHDRMLERTRIKHSGENYRFVHFGRLVFHKCTFLIIKSLAKTKNKIILDVVGTGPELESCKQLAKELNLEDRVNFLGWYTSHAELIDSLPQYRGVVFPSIEDANGIVIQESMALGLPPVCLDWGGPQLLVDNDVSGYLIEPKDMEFITDKIAECMDKLGANGEQAERFSIEARKKAETWRWSTVAKEWIGHYDLI